MKKITLTKEKFALVDDEDFDWLSLYKWQTKLGLNTFYARRFPYVEGKKTTLPMHRAILRATKGQLVDHIDGNGLNNQKENLRFCSKRTNAANSKLSKFNTSNFRGVTLHGKKWRAQIGIKGKSVRLGLFIDKKDAAKAYNKAALKAYGQFAQLNVI